MSITAPTATNRMADVETIDSTMLSRRPSHLEPFQRSLEAIRPVQRELFDLGHRDKALRDRLTEMSELIALKLAEMERAIKAASALQADIEVL